MFGILIEFQRKNSTRYNIVMCMAQRENICSMEASLLRSLHFFVFAQFLKWQTGRYPVSKVIFSSQSRQAALQNCCFSQIREYTKIIVGLFNFKYQARYTINICRRVAASIGQNLREVSSTRLKLGSYHFAIA
jgi:hypothetical protein